MYADQRPQSRTQHNIGGPFQGRLQELRLVKRRLMCVFLRRDCAEEVESGSGGDSGGLVEWTELSLCRSERSSQSTERGALGRELLDAIPAACEG